MENPIWLLIGLVLGSSLTMAATFIILCITEKCSKYFLSSFILIVISFSTENRANQNRGEKFSHSNSLRSLQKIKVIKIEALVVNLVAQILFAR